MDQWYDQNAARALLEQTITERAERTPKHLDLAEYSKKDGVAKQAHPMQVGRRCWKFVTYPDDQGVQEELVLRLQGIICDRNLPPVTKPQSIALRERRYQRQSIMLTGFGTHSMQIYVEGIQAIFHLFEQVLPVNALDKWNPSLFDGHVAIDMGNRFFTDRHDQANHELVPFKHSVDPDGILERAMGSDFVHLRENEVEYFECVDNSKGGKKYDIIDPSKLNKGGIVEVQISFVVVPIKNERFKLLIVMRAITLLDASPSKNAVLKKRHAQQPMKRIVFGAPILKRSVGYIEDDNEGSTENRMKRMNLNGIPMEVSE